MRSNPKMSHKLWSKDELQVEIFTNEDLVQLQDEINKFLKEKGNTIEISDFIHFFSMGKNDDNTEQLDIFTCYVIYENKEVTLL